MVGVDNFYSAKKIERRQRERVIERQAIAAANARGFIIVPPGSPAYLEDPSSTGTAQFKDDKGVTYNIYGQVLDPNKVAS